MEYLLVRHPAGHHLLELKWNPQSGKSWKDSEFRIPGDEGDDDYRLMMDYGLRITGFGLLQLRYRLPDY